MPHDKGESTVKEVLHEIKVQRAAMHECLDLALDMMELAVSAPGQGGKGWATIDCSTIPPIVAERLMRELTSKETEAVMTSLGMTIANRGFSVCASWSLAHWLVHEFYDAEGRKT